MRILVISNDVIAGFGVPVAAPGLRAQGLAEGIAAHGHTVSIAVPADLLQHLFPTGIPHAPDGVSVVSPPQLMAHIDSIGAEVVVFINSNLTPHLRPMPGVQFVYDLFAPKVLEGLASSTMSRPIHELIAEKERAFALADHVWVNGKRKVGYGLGWLLRDEVERIRVQEFGRSSLRVGDLSNMLTLVEMPIALPADIDPKNAVGSGPGAPRLGIAGYAQQWSSLDEVALGHSLLAAAGFELHALLPTHWGSGTSVAPASSLPDGVIHHSGPLPFDDFARWVQGMDAMVDLFEPSSERTFAMITRSAVALRLGIPLIHGIDSEISEIVSTHNAGWVVEPDDVNGWEQVIDDLKNADVLAAKRAGAVEASELRFEPGRALAKAMRTLGAGA